MENKRASSLYDFALQRPRICREDYSGYDKGYRQDLKEVGKQRAIFLALYDAVNNVLSIEEIENSLSQYEAENNRLRYNGTCWVYTAGQYWPLEYRYASALILWGILYRYVCNNWEPQKVKNQLIRITGKPVVNCFY